MKKKSYSSKSQFPPVGQTRFNCNLSNPCYKKLKLLTVMKGKPAGVIVEELISVHGESIEPQPKPHATSQGVVLTVSHDSPTTEAKETSENCLEIDDGVPAPEKKTVTSFSGKESLQVETGIPIPQISKQRVSFSHLIENTLKKMKVGNSFIIKGENQRSMSLGVAKKLKITLATRQTDSFKKDQTIRVWRVA